MIRVAPTVSAFVGPAQVYKLRFSFGGEGGTVAAEEERDAAIAWTDSAVLSQKPVFTLPSGGVDVTVGSSLCVAAFGSGGAGSDAIDANTIIGSSTLRVEASLAGQAVPLCLWTTTPGVTGSDIVNSFESLCLFTASSSNSSSTRGPSAPSAGVITAANAFSKFCGKKKAIIADMSFCHDVIAAERLSGTEQRQELQRILRQHASPSPSKKKKKKKKKITTASAGSLSEPVIPDDLQKLWLLVRASSSDAWARMHVLHKKFVKKKGKKLSKEIDKGGAQSLLVKVGSVSLQLADTVTETAALSPEKPKETVAPSSECSSPPLIVPGGREAFILVHGLDVCASGSTDQVAMPSDVFHGKPLRLESRVVSRDDNDILSRETCTAANTSIAQGVASVLKKTEASSVFIPGHGSRSPCCWEPCGR